jgi:hypothetical protein
MSLSAEASLVDVAFAVCTALDAVGETAVLTGGSAATFYAPDSYQSRDADFILRFGASRKIVDPAMSALGYERTPAGMYEHAQIAYTVEFPPGPLRVGRDLIATWRTARRQGELLQVLTPTDSVRDRFIAYFAWSDYSALAAAVSVAVARYDEFDRAQFEKWARDEVRGDSTYDANKIGLFFHALELSLRTPADS